MAAPFSSIFMSSSPLFTFVLDGRKSDFTVSRQVSSPPSAEAFSHARRRSSFSTRALGGDPWIDFKTSLKKSRSFKSTFSNGSRLGPE